MPKSGNNYTSAFDVHAEEAAEASYKKWIPEDFTEIDVK